MKTWTSSNTDEHTGMVKTIERINHFIYENQHLIPYKLAEKMKQAGFIAQDHLDTFKKDRTIRIRHSNNFPEGWKMCDRTSEHGFVQQIVDGIWQYTQYRSGDYLQYHCMRNTETGQVGIWIPLYVFVENGVEEYGVLLYTD